MKKEAVFTIIFPIIFAGIAFLTSNSFIVMGIVLLTSILYFIFFFCKRSFRYELKCQRFSSCYQFIDSFILALSVKETISGAMESVVPLMDKRFQDEVSGLEHLSDQEKLTYLKKFYPFSIYELFLNIIDIYQERGGNIFDISAYLMEVLRQEEESLSKSKAIGYRKMVEFVTLWGFSLLILVIMRFALFDLYMDMSSSFLFKGMIVTLFLYIIISIEFISRKIFSLPIQGDDVYV